MMLLVNRHSGDVIMYQILKKKKKNGTGRKWVLEQTDRNG
jgi:hypothetical protein